MGRSERNEGGDGALATHDPLTNVVYGEAGVAADAFQHGAMSAAPLDEVSTRLRMAIEAADLWVLHKIDPQAIVHRGEYAIGPTRQILFFHPRLMARLLEADVRALLEAPLKFVLLELPGGGVMASWQDMAAAFRRYGNPALAVLGRELADACAQVVAAALGPDAALPASGTG